MKNWFGCASAQPEDRHVPSTILNAPHREETNDRSSPRRRPDPYRQPAPGLPHPKDEKIMSSSERPAPRRKAPQRPEQADMRRRDGRGKARPASQRYTGSEAMNIRSSGRPRSASDYSLAVQEDTEVQVLLIGKTGNGKSSTGNAILGRSKPLFKVATGILSATEHTQLGESDDRKWGVGKLKMQVVDFPDVISDMDEESAAREVALCKTLTFPYPSAVCFVVRADVRFTPEEYATYQRTRELLGRHVHEKNMVVIFTMGDKLPADEKNFKEQLQRANRDLQQVLQDAGGRYVVFANRPRDGDCSLADHDRERRDVTRLLDIIVDLSRIQAADARPLSALLVGCPGTGKSATGNSILNADPTDPKFEIHTSLSRVMKDCETRSTTVRGFKIEIMDSPGLTFKEVDDLKVQHWFSRFKSGPNVLLFVIRVDAPFENAADFELFKKLKRVIGSHMNKHVIVVFTRGDHLARNHKTIESLLKESPPAMKNMLTDAGGGYVVFDNTTTSSTEKLLQRNRLLEKMAEISQKNKRGIPRVASPQKAPPPPHHHSNRIPGGGKGDYEGTPTDTVPVCHASKGQIATASSSQKFSCIIS